jgi:hypothetical protein
MNITYITETEGYITYFVPQLDGEKVDLEQEYTIQECLGQWTVGSEERNIGHGTNEDKACDSALDFLWDDLLADAEDAADLAQTHRDGYEAWTRG